VSKWEVKPLEDIPDRLAIYAGEEVILSPELLEGHQYFEFIVKCVNERDELVGALRDMKSILNGLHLNSVINFDKCELIRKTEEDARLLLKQIGEIE